MSAFGEIRDPLVGTRIDDRYLVSGVLGRGGMGVVYEGVHEQLGRPVAIKVLGAGIAGDPLAVQRFLREARTASQLTHGNIVDVSDLGQLPDGRPYLVMARMQGMDLCTLLQTKGPQSPRRTAELLRGAAAALDLIHAKGYVHRDVKPENLMHIVREDGSEAVLVLDFGIVGLVTAQASRLTAEGSVFGTPAYLPPEVIQGEQPDGRADTYSLATVAFELITGQTPFVATNPLKILPMKVLEDARSMTSVTGVEFPYELEAVMERALARDPKARYETTGAFIAALDAAARISIAPSISLRAIAADGGGAVDVDARAREQLRVAPTLGMEAAAPPEESRPLFGDTQPIGHDSLHRETAHLAIERRRNSILAFAGLVVCLFAAWLFWGRGPQPVVQHEAPPARPVNDAFQPAPPPTAAAEPRAAETPTAPVVPPAALVKANPKAEAPTPRHNPKPAIATPPPPAAATHVAPVVAASAPTATELDQAAQRELIQGHLAAAAELYAKATKLDPKNEPGWRGLGLASERLGKTAEAIKALKRAIALAPNGPNNDMLRARLEKLGGTP